MKISEVYEKYRIPNNLAEHMVRVAVVGHVVASNWIGETADVELTTLSCLLHDIGNVVKFNLDKPVVKIPNLDELRETQKMFRAKYGSSAHEANVAIIKEIGRDDIAEIIEIEHDIFGKSMSKIQGAPLPAQILLYSDVRVMPKGIVSMQERIDDLIARYGDKKYDMRHFPEFEEYLQRMTSIDITTIAESVVSSYFDEMLTLEV